ncbi:MAG: PiT family inorganic phosphate transporter [Bacteriovoracaceae bacterium]|jgi:PiT family inorganic phosphate transporter
MTLLLVFILIFALFLAYANGANDNFKGVATLYGSKTLSYKKALGWTTLATVLGSLTALYFASELIIVFKGAGLVPEEVIQLETFPVAVGLGAALTVMLATFIGLPVSTTHALVGALSGAGFMASKTGINFSQLANKFFLPLIGGPVISFLLAIILYPLFKRYREYLKVEEETCICIGEKTIATIPSVVSGPTEALRMMAKEGNFPSITIDNGIYCKSSYSGRVLGISAKKVLDSLHIISGGLVSFSRGLNDTPKIAALLLIGSRFELQTSILMVGLFMMIGGLIHSRKIAVTMGDKVTTMNSGQAFSANLVTAFMVFVASKMGVPVSTTHVSCGSIFGIAAITKKGKFNIIGQILLAWVTTLPLGFILGMGLMKIL